MKPVVQLIHELFAYHSIVWPLRGQIQLKEAVLMLVPLQSCRIVARDGLLMNQGTNG